MGLYVTFDDVRKRLIGKVRFTEDEDDENKMHVDLAERCINEAEGQVEMDLSPRYIAPFRGDNDEPFASLPDRPTREQIRTLCELQAVVRILETDFGKGTAVNGDKYKASVEKRYKEMVAKLLMRKRDRSRDDYGLGWFYPPLPGLKLNYMNNMGDDGFAGAVLVASGSPEQGYAANQINSPSETFFGSSLRRR